MSESISQRNEPSSRIPERNERWTHSFLFAPPKNERCDYFELLHEKRIGLERELNASNTILAGPKSFANSRVGRLQSACDFSRPKLILTYLK
jgi:hypothetical protein